MCFVDEETLKSAANHVIKLMWSSIRKTDYEIESERDVYLL